MLKPSKLDENREEQLKVFKKEPHKFGNYESEKLPEDWVPSVDRKKSTKGSKDDGPKFK